MKRLHGVETSRKGVQPRIPAAEDAGVFPGAFEGELKNGQVQTQGTRCGGDSNGTDDYNPEWTHRKPDLRFSHLSICRMAGAFRIVRPSNWSKMLERPGISPGRCLGENCARSTGIGMDVKQLRETA